jgi:hypothetical protein
MFYIKNNNLKQLEISSGVFPSSSNIIAAVVFRVYLEEEVDEKKERKGSNCFEDDENGFKALKISYRHSLHLESLNSDFIKFEFLSLEFFHEMMIINTKQ